MRKHGLTIGFLLSVLMLALVVQPQAEEKEKLRVEKERIKEQLRQDALRFRKALEAWGVEVKRDTNSDN